MSRKSGRDFGSSGHSHHAPELVRAALAQVGRCLLYGQRNAEKPMERIMISISSGLDCRALGRIGDFLVCPNDVASAQNDYPSRPVKIIVPAPPGGAADVLPRIISEKLAARWKQPVIVENRPGAALNLGAEAVAKAKPDGYTLLATPPGPLTIYQFIYANLRYDPSAFTPVTTLASSPFVLAVGPSIKSSDLSQFLTLAKANPGKFTFGSTGVGSPPHLSGEMLKVRVGHPFPCMSPTREWCRRYDPLGGRLDMVFVDLGSTLQHVRAGTVKSFGSR